MFKDITQNYKMTYEETKAYKIFLFWHETLKKLFPDLNHGRMTKGDPRKSNVFKYSYKLMRETQDKLQEDEYKLYVFAQLDILRRITINDSEKPLINVNCLTGEKAWKRWLLWKSKYEKLVKQRKTTLKVSTGSFSISLEKVIHGLKSTSEFLRKNIKENYSLEDFKVRIENGDFRRWILLHKISPYYLLLSNFYSQFHKKIDLKKLNIELDVYKVSINDNTQKIYEELFKNEKI